MFKNIYNSDSDSDSDMIVFFVYLSLTTARAFTFQSSSPTAYILRTIQTNKLQLRHDHDDLQV